MRRGLIVPCDRSQEEREVNIVEDPDDGKSPALLTLTDSASLYSFAGRRMPKDFAFVNGSAELIADKVTGKSKEKEYVFSRVSLTAFSDSCVCVFAIN